MDGTAPLSLVAADAAPIVLASGSATRADLLRSVGIPFEAFSPAVDEEALREALAAESVTGADAAVVLAETKARAVALRCPPHCIVLGADQLLELDGAWLAKPTDRTDARAQLRRLAGRTHRLLSAVVAFRGGSRVWHAIDVATLTLRPLSDAAIDAYLDAVPGDALGSVGAYRIEGPGLHLMDKVEGEHTTILGMPMLPLLRFLRDQRVLRI